MKTYFAQSIYVQNIQRTLIKQFFKGRQTSKKIAQKTWKGLSQKNSIHMANTHNDKLFNFISSKEVQTKTTILYLITFTQMVNLKVIDDIKCQQG